MATDTESLRVAQTLAGAYQGGAENFFARLATGLQQTGTITQKAFIRGHEHRLQSLKSGGVTAEGFRFGGPLNQVDRFRFRRALRAFRPDIVLSWMSRASKLTPKGDYTLVSRLGHYYNLKYYRHCDYWLGISRGICDYLVRGGMPADRVFHIPNFADEAEVQPLPRDSFNTPADRPLLLAAGRLHPNKGFDTLLQALEKVPDAILWLAGAGPEEDSLKELCRQLGLRERVRFLGWRSEVTALMRTADMFICPSRHEGLGSVIMESWAHGCPVIATDSQGPGELIEPGVTGIITPVDQPGPLAETINGLIADDAGRKQLSEAAQSHYRKHFSRAVIVDQYVNLFDWLKRRS
ncbi:glycosyltransferase [Microbulbifer flavimaris]|uniref:Glycosyltransferase n=1 Tax=Microbulbifer flavimaris TaxID=1781068 RepID=A0ABX4I3A6_9GAMM|nr:MULTISPECIES: glycosyltransferase [Microbulbifer]KUJ84571.1 glycosyltransferase [Microbulbifer sp. ZGT114]PCO06658.1 glycosyltransferase [Microbulbifer flavimaris]